MKFIYRVTKRIFDFILGLIGTIFLIPLIIIVKIAYICTGDFKSIFYSQTRIGYHGKKFKIYKFRSMVPNAGEILKELLKDKKTKEYWDKNHKLIDDPRITKIGKILRKTSLDEVPQVLNLLNGTMSFIGPRPLVEGELDEYNGDHELYESVKPGVTGWWAAHGRSEVNYIDRLDLEYYYIKNQGFKIDFLCLLKTVKVVLFKKGAK